MACASAGRIELQRALHLASAPARSRAPAAPADAVGTVRLRVPCVERRGSRHRLGGTPGARKRARHRGVLLEAPVVEREGPPGQRSDQRDRDEAEQPAPLARPQAICQPHDAAGGGDRERHEDRQPIPTDTKKTATLTGTAARSRPRNGRLPRVDAGARPGDEAGDPSGTRHPRADRQPGRIVGSSRSSRRSCS